MKQTFGADDLLSN